MQNLITVIAPQILVAGAYSFVGEIRSVVFELRWMLVFIVAMIIADFVLGIIDSVVKRGEDFRFSRAGRRTMCKFIEYNSYLVLGFGFGVAILQPVGICSYTTSSMCGLGIAIVFEFDSIMEKVNSETDANARWQLLIDAEKIMMDDLCYIPVFEKGTATLQNTKVKNLVIKAVGVPYTFEYVSK